MVQVVPTGAAVGTGAEGAADWAAGGAAVWLRPCRAITTTSAHTTSRTRNPIAAMPVQRRPPNQSWSAGGGRVLDSPLSVVEAMAIAVASDEGTDDGAGRADDHAAGAAGTIFGALI